MIAFEKKIPSNTNFCYCSECHICEETSLGIIIIVASIIIIVAIIIIIIIMIIIIIIIIIIHYHHHCYYYYHSINDIPYQCDINCAGHFTLDALASRPVACWTVEVNMINSLRPRQMDAISQTTFSNAFSRMKMNEFHLGFHWSLFLRFELTIFQHWFR